jgi:hypothetical protein
VVVGLLTSSAAENWKDPDGIWAVVAFKLADVLMSSMKLNPLSGSGRVFSIGRKVKLLSFSASELPVPNPKEESPSTSTELSAAVVKLLSGIIISSLEDPFRREGEGDEAVIAMASDWCKSSSASNCDPGANFSSSYFVIKIEAISLLSLIENL